LEFLVFAASRSRSRRVLVPVVLTAVAAGALSTVPSPARADDAPAPRSETVVGELVQGYADPGPVARSAGRAADPVDDGAGLLSWVQAPDGDSVRVPTKDMAHLPVGATVEVQVGAAVRDEASADGLEPARDVLAAEVVAPADGPVTAPTVGSVNHQVTVVMMEPAGTATQHAADPTTMAQVVSAVNGGVADFWAAQTGGAVRFGVVASYDWAVAAASCTQPFDLWQEAAGRAGWTEGPGKHLLVYVPYQSPGCSYGLGTVGGSLGAGGLAYVEGSATSVIAHEFGHNLGLGHSSSVQCDGAVDTGTCQTVAYGDYYDVMGVSWSQVGSLSAVQAARLGVLPAAATATVTSTSPVTTVTLAPVASATGTRALQLRTPTAVYWLEYRQADGQDAWLSDSSRNWPRLQSGVVLRRASSGSDTSLLLDGTPSTRSGWQADSAVALPIGQPVSVGDGEFTVTVAGGTTQTAAVVRVASASVEGPGAIDSYHQAAGGDAGQLGAATAPASCDGSGWCTRGYANGVVAWSPATGAHAVLAPVLARWQAAQLQPGSFGYPTTDLHCGSRGGCVQTFQHGSYAWSGGASIQAVGGAVDVRWAGLGRETGDLGYPRTDAVCGLTAGGCLQQFEGGTVYWTATVLPQAVTGAVMSRFGALGWEAGALGYPTSGVVCGLRESGCLQSFQRGTVYSTPANGVHGVYGPVADRWGTYRWEGGPFGYPTSDQVCGLAGGGCLQQFEGGTIYRSPAAGTHAVSGGVSSRWGVYGWEGGPVGYPVAEPVCGLVGGGCLQSFQGGTFYSLPGVGTHVVRDSFGTTWGAYRWEAGQLGYPVGDQVCGLAGGGCLQSFQGGTIYSSVVGTHAVTGQILASWGSYRWESGPLGYPQSEPLCGLRGGGCLQQFQGGTFYWFAGAGAHAVSGAIAAAWGGYGWENGSLGYPVEDARPVRDGQQQRFQGGTLTSSASTGQVRRS
jgi:uncharacterized protein with LGFP repeats